MGENNVCIGQFSIHYWEFAGYRAPDETMERPLPEYEVRYLREAPAGNWQPVQVEIPEGLRSIGDRAFEFPGLSAQRRWFLRKSSLICPPAWNATHIAERAIVCAYDGHSSI